MFTSGYYITAELKVKDATRAVAAKTDLQTLCEKTSLEEGCSLFKLHQVEGDNTRFLLWERFDDEAAYKLHFELPHTQAYLAEDYTEIVQVFRSNIAS